jgi:hypothetical protein
VVKVGAFAGVFREGNTAGPSGRYALLCPLKVLELVIIRLFMYLNSPTKMLTLMLFVRIILHSPINTEDSFN